MKCGFCERPLTSLTAICDCGQDPNAGWILNGRYQLLGLVGQGGMGMIYRALDQANDNRLCAIKISRWSEALQQLRQMETEAAKAEEKSRIEREFKLLQKAASRSPHIVQVFAQYQVDSRLGLYYPMEFLEGQSLAKLPEWGQPMPPREVVELVLQLCEGVGVAHGLGVAHRDLNPENIFIVRTPERERFVKLIDFGIARDLYARKGIYNTGSDLAFGHLQYLAPEQVGYDPVTDEYQRETAARLDHRADIYSIGAIMFHMLTGQPPFDDNTIEGLATRNWRKPPHLAEAIKESTLPHELQELIISCLQPSPDLRLPDIFALSDLLQSYLYEQRSEEAFDALVQHASHTTELGPEDEELEVLDQASWEFPAIEGSWGLPGSATSVPELSVFSKEFDNLFDEEESVDSAPLSDVPPAPSGVLETPVSEERTLPPTLEYPPPPPNSAEAATAPKGKNGLSAAPATSVPKDVWTSLDNAPAFVDTEEEADDNRVEVVIDHYKLNVDQFFDGVEEIIEEHGEVLQQKAAPSIYGLPMRSPQLENLLSQDNLHAAAAQPIPEDKSSAILASELLTAMEEVTIDEHEPAPPTPAPKTRSRSTWTRFTPSSSSLPQAPPAGAEDNLSATTQVAPHDTAASDLMPSTQPSPSHTKLWIILAVVGLGVGVGLGVYFLF